MQAIRYEDLSDLADELNALAEAEELDEEERDRYDELKSLDDQLGGMEDYARNETVMIPKLDFEDYAEEFAYEVGAIDNLDRRWPLYCIDWERAARELAMDYTEVRFDGIDYMIRAY